MLYQHTYCSIALSWLGRWIAIEMVNNYSTQKAEKSYIPLQLRVKRQWLTANPNQRGWKTQSKANTKTTVQIQERRRNNVMNQAYRHFVHFLKRSIGRESRI
jgi:hypothetical protein